jgi:outer membrane protein assembly factor BamB
LVGSGKTLFAIDGKDGRELWSMEDLDLGDWRGRNLLEIPGTPILLAKRAPPRATDTLGALLALDLWKGTILWEQAEGGSLVKLVPLYESERFLLITDLGYEHDIKLQLQLHHMFENKVDWRSRSQSSEFYVFDAQVYVKTFGGACAQFLGFLALEASHLDLRTGKSLWKFVKRYFIDCRPGDAPLIFVDGKILYAGKDVFALDPLSGKPLWKAEGLGIIWSLGAGRGVIFGSGEKGAFALDPSTGMVRWRVKTQGNARIFLFEESDSLVVCDQLELLVVDAHSGKILRRSGHKLESTYLLQKIGLRFLLLGSLEETALYDVTTGQWLAVEEPTHKAVVPCAFLLDRENWKCLVPSGLKGRLQAALPMLRERAGENSDWQRILERLEPILRGNESEIGAYAARLANKEWKLWRIDPETGRLQKWTLTGEGLDFIPGFALAYTFTGNTLRAFKLGED